MHQQNLTMAMMDVWWACRADINIMDVMHAASGYSSPHPRAHRGGLHHGLL